MSAHSGLSTSGSSRSATLKVVAGAASAWSGATPAATGSPTSARIDDDVESGLVLAIPANTFGGSRHSRRRQGCDRLVRPFRPEVLWVTTRWRLLQVGGHHAIIEDAHAIFGSIWNEFLEKVVASS